MSRAADATAGTEWSREVVMMLLDRGGEVLTSRR
jgi:hypothetical protein